MSVRTNMQLFFSHCTKLPTRVLFCPKKCHMERIEAQLHFSCLPLLWGSWGRTAQTMQKEKKKCVYTCHKGQGLNPLQYIIVTYVPNVARLPGNSRYRSLTDPLFGSRVFIIPHSLLIHIYCVPLLRSSRVHIFTKAPVKQAQARYCCGCKPHNTWLLVQLSGWKLLIT